MGNSPCIVKISTSAYISNHGEVTQQRRLRIMRRLSKATAFVKRPVNEGCPLADMVEEDISASGATEFLARVTNWDKVSDGLYVIETINPSTDWETGYVDDWDYILVPYQKEVDRG